MKIPHWHQIIVIFMIYTLLSRNFDVRIYAVFPQIFGNWKVDSADFFTFRMYGFNHLHIIIRSINLSYLGFEEDFLFFFWISLPSFLVFLFFFALRFRFSPFMPWWLSSLCCFWAILLVASFWFFCLFLRQSPSEPSLANLPSLLLLSLNSDSWSERRIKERNINIACLPGEIMLPSFELTN